MLVWLQSSVATKTTTLSSISLTVQGTESQHKTSQILQKMACETGLTHLEHIELREKLDKLLDNFKASIQRTDTWVKNLPTKL